MDDALNDYPTVIESIIYLNVFLGKCYRKRLEAALNGHAGAAEVIM